MPELDEHRRVENKGIKIIPFKPPFSCFEFIEEKFGDYESFRRIFSFGRSSGAQSLVIEKISPAGIIAEENEDIFKLYPGYSNDKLLRISFWKNEITENLKNEDNDKLIGYAILKSDRIKDNKKWHVFEAVLIKYDHEHNCLPRPKKYIVKISNKIFKISGMLFCQQNSLNKACAQVALRTLLSRLLPEGDISYRTINDIAEQYADTYFNPANGLTVKQIRGILHQFNIKFSDIDYLEEDDTFRDLFPYQKYIYAGLESGSGALVGFNLAGAGLREQAKHIIPIFGHTFNKDTWVPNAEMSYFHIGEGVGYLPSENWTSSFLGHDDNFGPNFCIPRIYIDKKHIDYVVEVFQPGFMYGGMQAEAMALGILYSILPNIKTGNNKWMNRLLQWTIKQQIVFRAQAMNKIEYINHLQSLIDWEGQRENTDLCKSLKDGIDSHLWVVEISTPQLFPANERKLGEIVLKADMPLKTENYNDAFILARLPGNYLFGGQIINGIPELHRVDSRIISHTGLIKL